MSNADGKTPAGNIKLGRHSYCYGVQRGTMNTVHVGNFSSIAEGVIFDGGFNHETKNATTFPLHRIWSELPSNIKEPQDIHIGSDVWIGEGAVIMANKIIFIGNGAIVGAGCVVTKSIPAYCIAVGSPMQIIGQRFSDYHTLALQRLRWWNWSDEKIRENAELLTGGIEGIVTLLNKYYTGDKFPLTENV